LTHLLCYVRGWCYEARNLSHSIQILPMFCTHYKKNLTKSLRPSLKLFSFVVTRPTGPKTYRPKYFFWHPQKLPTCRLWIKKFPSPFFFFIKKIWNISSNSDEKLRKHALFHWLSTLNKWLFFERWKIIKQKQIRFVIELK